MEYVVRHTVWAVRIFNRTRVTRAPARTRTVLLGCFLSCLLFGTVGCVSSPSTRVPAWISSFPSMPDYYVGIGSSHTGNQSDDMRMAKSRALADLAGTISTHIVSEQQFTTRETSQSRASSIAEVVITESVTEHLQAVETYDSYYADDLGYWFLLRLNRQRWTDIQNAEVYRLSTRVTDLITNEVVNADPSAFQSLTVLAKAWELLAESPYAGFIDGELFGKDGTLLDLVESELQRRIEAFSVVVDPKTVRAEIGDLAVGSISIASELYEIVGPVQFDVSIRNDADDLRMSFTGNDTGDGFFGVLDTSNLELGTYSATVSVPLDQFGISTDRIPTQINTPRMEFVVEIDKIHAKLETVPGEGIELIAPDGALKALISKIAPFRFDSLPLQGPTSVGDPKAPDNSGRDGSYIVRIELAVREAPKSEYTRGMTFVFLRAVISVEANASSVFLYQSDEFKEGGLDSAQAQARAFNLLIDTLATDEVLQTGLNRLPTVR